MWPAKFVFFELLASALLASVCGTIAEADVAQFPRDDAHARALETLRTSLKQQQGFAKVHAAESLVALSLGEEVADIFRQELKIHGEELQYRTGIWRTLAQAAKDSTEASEFIQRLNDVALDPQSPDRGHALEALAKLRYQVPPADRPKFESLSIVPLSEDAICKHWLLAGSGSEPDLAQLVEALSHSNPRTRELAAYALQHLRLRLPSNAVKKLGDVAAAHRDSAQILSAAYATAISAQTSEWLNLILPMAKSKEGSDRIAVANALAIRGSAAELPTLIALLDDSEADVRINAANAILRIDRRNSSSVRTLDWIVLMCYAGVMIAIGWFYSRVKSVDEYLLGGRTMKPWAVGISLFASLISTLSYLAVPGEMIRHGPMILATVLSYPLAYVIISRCIIPSIMRLRVTSAYEILERRLGLSVRMLGSGMFLTLRLLWMSLIVLATSAEVIVPLFHLDKSMIPWVCAALCLITVAYTSMGGLRAVVVIDVVQVGIMFAGALLSIFLIVRSVGGVAACWPTTWAPQWDTPSLLPVPGARVSVIAAILAQLTWFVCTSGSDQLAIQRYLATRDANAARQTLRIALCLDTVVAVILAILGLALFAFFQANPSMLPDGETIDSSADQLLTHYIVRVLPVGVSGLIIAGILSAAMNSLSSGVNSTCSVIAIDWVERFRRVKQSNTEQVRQVKFISWMVGVVVVLLSLLAAMVQGNLLEKCYTVVNLFVAPLFVLFFMAMFVPWATVFGTWIAALASISVAVAIAYGNLWNLSFLMIMPISLVVGTVTGCVFSMLPIGIARPMLETER